MKRRKFLENTVIGTSTAITLGAVSSARSQSGAARSQNPPSPSAINLDQPSVRWRMATSWPKSLQILFEGANILCEKVNKMTNGRFVITPYEAGELTGGLKVLEAVQNGTVQCGHTASYYYLDQSIALAFGTTVPFGLTALQQNAWLYYGGGLEAMRQLYQDFDIINFPGGNTGTQMGGWFKQEVNTIDDFKGLRMRLPGLGGKILERLGAEIVLLPGDKIFLALEQQEIDAAEWKNPHADQMLGLNKVAPLYYYPVWWEPGTSYEFQVNIKEWQKLPKQYQKIFQAAAADANMRMLAKFNSVNGEVLQQLELSGTKLLPFSDNILQASYKTAFEMYEEIASKNSDFRNIYDQWKVFREHIYLWNKVNEIAFADVTMNRVITS